MYQSQLTINNIGGEVVKENEVYTLRDNTHTEKSCGKQHRHETLSKHTWSQT
jgi:hypothetical protein